MNPKVAASIIIIGGTAAEVSFNLESKLIFKYTYKIFNRDNCRFRYFSLIKNTYGNLN